MISGGIKKIICLNSIDIRTTNRVASSVINDKFDEW